ncbi:hypothetical protein [Tenacibaculum finnmarkense]|uniref:hypothetical protein n=1 Tax=Tenacibaculum finnmarkense TaxID=2781243 RepID=UPI001EFB30FC|nr:hypothetical protein [Tenacibaculum finnmarkense]MCG8226397.1 hypothetical protein [Tenacibaculum finnmarkense genomovar finnmarkense]
MNTQTAETLAKEYETGETKECFYSYIVESMANGQRQQVKKLFSEMANFNKEDFLINWLDVKIGIHKSTLNMCIIELLD